MYTRCLACIIEAMVAQSCEVATAHNYPLTACRGLSSCFWISKCSQVSLPALWRLKSSLEA